MSSCVRIDTTISKEFYEKIKAFHLNEEKGIYAEALRRGLKNIIDEIQGNNTVYIPKEKREIVAHPSIIQRIQELAKLLEETKVENTRLSSELEMRR